MQLLQRRFALGAAAVIVAMASAASAGPTSAQSKQDWAFATDVMSRSNGAFYGVAVSPAGRVRIDFFADQRLLATNWFLATDRASTSASAPSPIRT